MAKVINPHKSRTIATEAEGQTIGQASEPNETVTGDSDGIKTALQPAFRTYLEGRKGLAEAFKEREYQDQEAYRDAERRYHLCAEAIEKAMKAREKAELDASDAYKGDVDKAVDKASQAYKDRTKQALIECKQKVMDAWRSSTEASVEMAGVCEEAVEKAMKAREKAEMDALLAYRQEVDRAVDKASQVYKDKMRQALADCRERIVDAWRSSMETSARMTGIFEEDENTRTEEEPAESRPVHQSSQFREMILHVNRGCRSAIQRTVKALAAKSST